MTNREVELLAIGAGPSNLALAVAVEELGFDGLAENSLLIERAQAVQWQQGLLLPWAKSQASFIKDLVSLRNPRSKFSFLNYLHSVGRLDDFINMGSFTPYRAEISAYLSWVAESLTKVRVELGCECVSAEPVRNAAGVLTGWLTRLADGSTVSSKYLVIGAGREPYIPPALAGLPASRLIHSTQYRTRMSKLAKDRSYRVAVIGSAQSSAEMFRALQDDLPGCDLTWVMRSIGLRAYETNKFMNELYYPSFVDKVFEAQPEGRSQILREMHRTNYSGISPGLLESLYSDLYLDRLAGRDSKHLITMADIRAAREADGDAVIELADRRTGAVTELRLDLVFLGTGFDREMPALIRGLTAALGVKEVAVTRRYRLVLDEQSDAACYLQGVNEASHGIADSLLSIVGNRGTDVARDIIAARAAQANGNGHRGRPDQLTSAHLAPGSGLAS
jgi:L-ornithine N5-oxygenase